MINIASVSLASPLETIADELGRSFGEYGFAVVRDPIACKHAVMAETDDWVAMATEYRAIAHLPGADTAKIWEPEPTIVYTWGGHA